MYIKCPKCQQKSHISTWVRINKTGFLCPMCGEKLDLQNRV